MVAASLVPRAVVFVGASGLVLVHAFNSGSYDAVVRGQLGLLVAWTLTLGLVTGLLPRARPSLVATAIGLTFAGLIAWTALSLIWTESDERTVVEIARLLHHAGILVLVWSALDRSTIVAAGAGLAVGCVAVCVVALLSRLTTLFGMDLFGVGSNYKRLQYPLGYWNATAAFAAMTLALVLPWSVHASRRAHRALALSAVPGIAAVIYLTYSRAGLASAFVAVLLSVVLARLRLKALASFGLAIVATVPALFVINNAEAMMDGTSTAGAGRVILALVLATAACAAIAAAMPRLSVRKPRLTPNAFRAALIATTVVVALTAAALGPSLADTAWRSFTSPGVALEPGEGRQLDLSGNRSQVYAAALNGLAAHPITGLGAGSFEFWWNREARDPEFVRDAHSLYLEWGAELGAVGLVLLLALLATCGVAGRRACRAATTDGSYSVAVGASAALIVWAVHSAVDWLWEATGVTVVALAAVGLVVNMPSIPKRHTTYRARALAAAIAAVTAVAHLVAIASPSEISRSEQAVRRGDFSAARSAANQAIAAAPWAASPLVQRALLFESHGYLDDAITDARKAERLEPTNWRHPLILARLLAERDRPHAALRAYAAARRLRPLGPVFRRR